MAVEEKDPVELQAPWVKPDFWEEPYQTKNPRWKKQEATVTIDVDAAVVRATVKLGDNVRGYE